MKTPANRYFDNKLAEWVKAGKPGSFFEFTGMTEIEFTMFVDQGLNLSADRKKSAHYHAELRRRERYQKK